MRNDKLFEDISNYLKNGDAEFGDWTDDDRFVLSTLSKEDWDAYWENTTLDTQVLSSREYGELLYSFATSRGESGFTIDETVKVLNWGVQTKISEALFNLIMKGHAQIDWDNEKAEVTFQITDKGKEMVEDS